jgi:pimeloyl-ACP methyl ester carboxylesterase
MLDWPSVEPGDFRCPMLWLIGSKDPHAITSLQEYQASLDGSRVQVHVVEGLDHEQVFEQIDQVLPVMLAFTQSA